MFLKDILNELDYRLLLNKYDFDYLKSIDYCNFMEVYIFLENRNVYFINDLLIHYLEIFTLDFVIVEKAFNALFKKYGDDYISIIGNNMSLLDDAIIVILEKY